MSDDEPPSTIQDLQTPCLLVDIQKVKENAQEMIDKCKSLGVTLRPHMKTHKCREIGVIATGYTKKCIAVSTLSETEMFADAGFDDIVFAALFTKDKILRVKRLASRVNTFHVATDNEVTIQLLEDNPLVDRKWSVVIMVDCGSSREGVLWDDDGVLTLAKRISNSSTCSFHGVYAHEGHSYLVRGVDEVDRVGGQAAERILDVANKIRALGISCPTVGLGSTPTASRPNALMKDLTELHPGNYIFYDVQQTMIGSCQLDNVAVKVATRVIGHYPHRNQLLVDAGWTSVSLDGHKSIPNGSYCLIQDHPNLKLVKMTQEVGFMEPSRGKLNYDKYPIGMMLLLYPYHSCATAVMHSRYFIHEGDKIIDVWMPCRGW